MTNLITRIIGDKKEWKAMEARARVLPGDYRVVYGEMKSYLWRFTAGDGMDVVALLEEVLALFEAEAARGVGVLEVTGPDVAAFCDERRSGLAPYQARWHTSLNRDVARRLAD